MSGSHCVDCIQAADNIKNEAQKAGREAALKAARGELAREQKEAERAKLKEQAAALKAQQKANNLKAARATERAKREAEKQAALAPQVAPVEPVRAILCALEDDDDGRPPWE